MADCAQIGRVYLVGAGPGDDGLITVKGLACLQQAEVVVYDRLAPQVLRQWARPDALLISCGKAPGHHEMTQDEINQALVEHALAGRVVCRLKGGDPFVFGRGGEEGLALQRHNVPFEVIPGISSAVAAPAYAGIPVTHRGVATSFAVVTGHEDPGKPEAQVQWEKLATAVDTIVILMGVGNLPAIAERLLDGGRAHDTPVAIVNCGTYPEQTTLVGTLADIAVVAMEADIRPPAAVIVGEVVNLRQRLAWFDNRPLSGRRGLVTRTRSQASELSALLRQYGALPIEMPVIQIAPPESWAPWEAALAEMCSFDWIVFSSVNAIETLQRRLRETGQDIRALHGPRIAAIGARTAAAAERAGLHVSLCPEEYVGEALAQALAGEGLARKRLLLLGAAEGREVVAEAARAAGAEVVRVPVYQTRPVEARDPEALAMLRAGEIDFVTCASSSSVRNLIAALGPGEARSLLAATVIACLGPVTAQTARGLGLSVSVVPDEHTIEALVSALACHYSALPRRIDT